MEWFGGTTGVNIHQVVLVVLSCANALAISWAGINAQKYVSATTFMVLTNANKFVPIAFGMLVLHEARSVFAIGGCATALGCGMWYDCSRLVVGGL